MVLVVHVVGEVVLNGTVLAVEGADDVTQCREGGRALRILPVLDTEVGHRHLLQGVLGAGHPHRERRLVVVGNPARQGARALEAGLDRGFHGVPP